MALAAKANKFVAALTANGGAGKKSSDWCGI